MRLGVRWIAACLTLTALGGSSAADAAVIYVNFVPDFVVEQRTFIPDLNNDGDRDLLFNQDLGCVGNCLSFATVSGLGVGGGVLTSGGNVTPLSTGASIGPASSTFASGGLLARDGFSGQPPITFLEEGLWDNGLTAFVGFRFLIGTNLHYGWARVRVEETSNIITVFDAAYEGTAGAPITAGAVPEPGSLALALVSGAALIERARARRRRI